MKKVLFILLALITFNTTTFAQADFNWNTEWENVYPREPLKDEPRVRMQFAMVHPDGKGDFTGQPHRYSWYRIENQFTKPNSHLTFNIDYKRYDGSTGTLFINVDLSKPETSFSSVGNWFSGYEITSKPYNVKSSDKIEAETLKPQLDAAQTNFITEFNTYTTQLNTLPAGSEKKQYTQTLNSSVSQFNSAFGLAAQYYKSGDGPKLKQQLAQIDLIKAHLDTSLNLMHDVVERPGLPISQASTKPSVQTSSNSATTATKTYNATQAQTQTYINNSQNPNNDAIQNTLALNQAKINAMKPGGATAQQKQQIQQVGQQQASDQTGMQTVVTVGNTLNSVLDNALQKRGAKLETSKAQFDYVGDKLLDRFFPVRLNNKWGLIDEKGKLICPVKYDEVGYMGWSAAYGADKYIRVSVRVNDRWGLIDVDGKEITEIKYFWIRMFADQNRTAVELNGKWGIIDRDGKEITPIQYDAIKGFNSYNIRWAAVKLDGKWIIIDEDGKAITALQYDNVINIDNKNATVELNGRQFRVDKKGREMK